MTTQHFFLSSPDASLPERLHEAFPDIKSLDAAALKARMADASVCKSIVWLSSADVQWPLALRQILQNTPDACVVLLSGAPEPAEGLRALNEGARGYAHAYAVPALMKEVAMVIEHGGLWVGPDILQRLVVFTNAALANQSSKGKTLAPAGAQQAPNAWTLLSAREAQVARAVSAGRSNREIAVNLFISERTVKAHLGAIFEKLKVRDRLQLVLRLAASVEPAESPAQDNAP